jgi:hypothetical protein
LSNQKLLLLRRRQHNANHEQPGGEIIFKKIFCRFYVPFRAYKKRRRVFIFPLTNFSPATVSFFTVSFDAGFDIKPYDRLGADI